MRVLRTESFDRFGRYRHIWELRRSLPDDPPLRILDVGDPYGIVGQLFDTDVTVSVDLLAEPRPARGVHWNMVGSGLQLPFADASFDLVASHDALEHVPQPVRASFLSELLRVSRGPVLVVAPFADPRTARCEEIVNGYYTARFGHGLVQLEEHRTATLPDPDWLSGWLTEQGEQHVAWGDGWLYNWLAFMLVKGHLVSEGLDELDRRIDIAYNEELADLDRRAPHYRRCFLVRPPEQRPRRSARAEDADTVTDDVAGDLVRLMQLAVELTECLPRGESPASPGSRLNGWIDAHLDSDEPVGAVASSLRRALEGAALTAPPPAPAVPSPPESLLSVSIVIVNLDGADHLRDCLRSLQELDYPDDLLEMLVVDNGSTDDSLDVLAEHPQVRVLPQGENLGFAPAVNLGVAAATGECLLLLNNDIRVEPGFVRELVRSYEPDQGYVCVGAQILSWDGERVDFGEGSVNFYGMGAQIGYGTAVDQLPVPDGAELLFACGGAMLIQRATYLDVGGFDDAYFAYFEDVDLGWRLRILGHRIRLAAEARCYHRMHGTSSRFPYHQRLFLYERNALRSMLKNYEARTLPAALSSALLLLAKRGAIAGQLDRSGFIIGGAVEPTEEVAKVAIAGLHAVDAVVDSLDEILAKREEIQRRRVVADHEVAALFGFPFLPTEPARAFVEAQYEVASLFGLDRIFTRERGSRALVVTSEVVGRKMRGPAIRALEVAKALCGEFQVTLAVPQMPAIETGDVEVATYEDGAGLLRLAAGADVVVVQGYTVRRHPELRAVDAVLVADLYDPWLFEAMEVHRGAPWADEAAHNDVSVLNELLDTADMFVCASERQRDYWMGMLAARQRLDETTYAWDPTLRQLIDVVPFGLPARGPQRRAKVLKGVHPAVGEDDLVVLWGGGAWDWFDPVSVIHAFSVVVRLIPRAKLYFLGLQLVDDNVNDMKMAHDAVATAKDLGLEGTSVIFGDWAPYEEREAFLLESDVAVSAARDLAETRLAFRSRLLDAFWAGIPVVTTEGDVLAEVVRETGAGIVVAPGDVGGLADAMIRLLGNPVLRADAAARSRELSERFRWRECVEPLRRVLRAPWGHLEMKRHRKGRQSTATTWIMRQMREELKATASLRDHAAILERLYLTQQERAELHLGEVYDLLAEREAAQEQLAEAKQRVAELESALAGSDAQLHRLRSHPAFRAAVRVKEAGSKLRGGGSRS